MTPAPDTNRPALASVTCPVAEERETHGLRPAGALSPRGARPAAWARKASQYLLLAAILGLAVLLRVWHLDAIGFNSDEAVYTGSAASLAGDHSLGAMFPVFRAHPLLFQTLLSLVLRVSDTDMAARGFAAAIGVAQVALTWALGRRLYGRAAGLLAALLLAAMPYQVAVSRQVLLDGLMTLCATAALYCVARYIESPQAPWLLAGGAMMGTAVLAKETSIVLAGGLYVFFALTPAARLRLSHLAMAVAVMITEVAVWPVMLRLSGHSRTGQNYLLWQMFRRPNHGFWFYFTTLPAWIGPAVLLAAAAGLLWLRKEATWRERLLLAWLAVPVLFFTIWPVKGFQYLLPISPPLAVLAGRALARPLPLPGWLSRTARWRDGWPGLLPGAATLSRMGMALLAAAAALSLAVPAWSRVEPAPTAAFLAGSGGLPGGREAGDWIRHALPRGSRLLAIGPSVANVLEYYGRHPVSALSVSTDPRNRNPSYSPVPNPDLALRRGDFQYVVWDAYTAARTPHFAARALKLAARYHGIAVYTSTVTIRASATASATEPVIIIYEVHP